MNIQTKKKKRVIAKKISLSKSMRILTLSFLESYNWDLRKFNKEEDIINDLYFYWLSNSAERQYYWCEEIDEDVFSVEFAKEIKKILRKVYKDIVRKRNNSQ